MKNFMIYSNRRGEFDAEHEKLARVQIDNSLYLGWKREDILLVTNFEYEYQGVRSLVLHKSLSKYNNGKINKIFAIVDMFKKKYFKDDEVYFFHDFDAFQLISFDDPLRDGVILGLTDYGFKCCINTGVMFINNKSYGVFKRIKSEIKKVSKNVQEPFATEIYHGKAYPKIQLLDSSYNFGPKRVGDTMIKTNLPIKVAHFHPKVAHKNRVRSLCTYNPKIGMKVVDDRLINLIGCHGLYIGESGICLESYT